MPKGLIDARLIEADPEPIAVDFAQVVAVELAGQPQGDGKQGEAGRSLLLGAGFGSSAAGRR